MGEAVEFFDCNCFSKVHCEPQPDQHLMMTMEENHHHHHHPNDGTWFEEEIDDDLKWSFALNRFQPCTDS